MINDHATFRTSVSTFCDKLMHALYARIRDSIRNHHMDHVCYRVATMERYEWVKAFLGNEGELIAETPYAGRPIAVFRLREKIHGGSVLGTSLIELPAPKAESSYPEGWEHGEFVVTEPLEHFMARHPHLDFSRRALGKKLNPEVSLKLEGGISAKFHRVALDEVIRLEEALGITAGM